MIFQYKVNVKPSESYTESIGRRDWCNEHAGEHGWKNTEVNASEDVSSKVTSYNYYFKDELIAFEFLMRFS